MANTADGFKAKMTELGYIEGENIVYDHQKTNFDMAAYKRTLKKFVADKVDLDLRVSHRGILRSEGSHSRNQHPSGFCRC